MIEDDVRERFLREIAAQVPADRIAELHLFRPLRRGGTETGVAVIAVEQEAPPQEVLAEEAPAHGAPAQDSSEAHGQDSSDAHDPEADHLAVEADDNQVDVGPYAAEPALARDAMDAEVDDTIESSTSSSDDVELRDEPVAEADLRTGDADADGEDDETLASADAPSAAADSVRGYADVAGDDDSAHLSADEFSVDGDASDRRLEAFDPGVEIPVATASVPSGNADVSLAKPQRPRHVRHTVFTARYRLTRKGVDRGKWEFEVVADADAPLGTVDMVVRGVQRRAGDDEEPERLTAEGVRAALDGQAWQRTT